MFLKQTTYKPRTSSQSSGSDQGSERTGAAAQTDTMAKKEDTTAQQSANPAIAGRRRSSDIGKFSGLNTHKRNSKDLAGADRRTSFSDQSAPGGLFSQAWSKMMKGT